MTERPLVSILTPSYEQAAWLQENLASVAAQTYGNVEHIVMDGGSTDGSVDILRGHDSPNLVWRSEPDRGQSHALNKALEASSGEILGWINSDDAYVDRRTIDWVVDCFQRHPKASVVFGHAIVVDETGLVLQFHPTSPVTPETRRRGNPIIQPSAFLRRSAIPDPFVREELHLTMDSDLWLRMLSARYEFRHVPRILAMDRHQTHRKVIQQRDELQREYRELGAQHGVDFGLSGRALRARERARQRIGGLPSILTIERRIEPACQLTYDARPLRALRQAVLPRHRFASASGRRRTPL